MADPSSLADLALRTLGRLLTISRWFWDRAWRDHRTLGDPLHGGWILNTTQGGHSRFYLAIAVAPSRRLPHKRRQLTPERARRFVAEARPGLYPEVPVHSTGDTVHFEVMETDSSTHIRRASIWSTGHVSFMEQLPVFPDANEDHTLLRVEDIVMPIAALAAAIGRGAYARLINGPFPQFRRLDWFVAVTPHLSSPTGRRPWDDLVFPATRPSGRATNASPWVPHVGYGSLQLQSRRQRTKPKRIVRVVLEDLLRQCGYIGYELAVADSLRVVLEES